MTFDQFIATKQWSDDISKRTGLDVGGIVAGYVYESDLHIFAWQDGNYQLVIFGDETVSTDLGMLERKLYDFASDDAMFA